MSVPLHAVEALEEPRPAPTHVLAVRLAGPRGERWSSVGVGDTVEAALAWARESAPGGTAWLVSGWSDLYGD